ncbi:hypothetical protein N7452_007747 [Penicillium brevicompactum]|uniref:Uncharacterized protein n=1 Tax=Penicillium brevicompactum TaxID=5074 RepID=A0A9W9QFU4_PENBR|nr:hypothetical protein N7452_007747 [Penicillium brevicompactum]
MYAVHKAQHVVEIEKVPAAVRSDESASTPIQKRKRSEVRLVYPVHVGRAKDMQKQKLFNQINQSLMMHIPTKCFDKGMDR